MSCQDTNPSYHGVKAEPTDLCRQGRLVLQFKVWFDKQSHMHDWALKTPFSKLIRDLLTLGYFNLFLKHALFAIVVVCKGLIVST